MTGPLGSKDKGITKGIPQSRIGTSTRERTEGGAD